MVDLTKDKDQKHRAWYKIKYKSFLVSIPSYLIPQRETEARQLGQFSTGSRQADQQMARQREQIWLPLIDLINIYINNGDFTFLKPNKDIPTIHEILQTHIDDFLKAEKAYRSGLYSEDEQVMNERRRDMLQIDEFAREIYKRAFRKELPKDSLFKGIEAIRSPWEQLDDRSKLPVPVYESVANHVDYSALRSRRKPRR
jgi:hypothetical protein